jgi:crossover junction endodeoxyribonuclease RuvC
MTHERASEGRPPTAPRIVRVLGVDPGTTATGWGVVERRGSRISGVAAGVIRVSGTIALPERLRVIHDALRELIAAHAPDEVAVEDVFHGRYAQAALKLGHVRGVALLAVAQSGLPLRAYPPAVVKRTVGGKGSAQKEQVARMVCAVLGWTAVPAADAADALAVAVTHVQARGLSRR